ncbi:hypothetical protein BDN67DRAFT_170703 [Paxillus ammoniavirescens]|nr:hypothetical protein BDN67DRAFT_170703 [Paxillus ammoniavirescens]
MPYHILLNTANSIEVYPSDFCVTSYPWSLMATQYRGDEQVMVGRTPRGKWHRARNITTLSVSLYCHERCGANLGFMFSVDSMLM